ncbi:helix-turn-helix domain-containing protein [Pantoea agglomerans]|uniref:helix-turn-helix domain-containing protein n=1 Tax=Enterobacter agglomerans TaxID=549 RepID=UPI0028970EE4|nr:helix-turn-helix domain-containing protein [Pantoea agglomerans]WNK35846.1 helix-turn-helix domain-containing protein [Pantoea agglomerans]
MGISPADWVLICSLETGTSLEWLTYGRGDSNITNEDVPSTKIELKKTQMGTFHYLIGLNMMRNSYSVMLKPLC